jgi:hypothetical protein
VLATAPFITWNEKFAILLQAGFEAIVLTRFGIIFLVPIAL